MILFDVAIYLFKTNIFYKIIIVVKSGIRFFFLLEIAFLRKFGPKSQFKLKPST